MTTVEISGTSLTAKGHAGYGPLGRDVVCAAVSILTQTLAECLLRQESKGSVADVSLKLEPGDAEIRWKGEAECLPAIETGFELLNGSYPEYVILKVQK